MTWTSNSDIVRIPWRINAASHRGLLLLPLDPLPHFIELPQRRRSAFGVSLKLRSILLDQRSVTLLFQKERIPCFFESEPSVWRLETFAIAILSTF